MAIVVTDRAVQAVVSRAVTEERTGQGIGKPRVCIIGPSTRFMSGLTYYTYGLCRALSARCEVSALLMRQLIPTRFYPGAGRVGADLSDISLPAAVRRFDGVDWFWFPSLFAGLWFLLRRRPAVLVMQWWTGAVLHTYLVLALVATLLRIKIVIEFHEMIDSGEANLPGVRKYVGACAPRLFSQAAGFIVHSECERGQITDLLAPIRKPTHVIPHPTYDHYRVGTRWREAPEECLNIVYFGLIRPYKGLEDLVRAFDAIPAAEIDRYWLTVVGETWENWTLPSQLIEASRYHERITFVNRYVSDDEVAGVFGGADLVVLPYHRSAQSGALHVAMHYGLPVVVTGVGGMVEAVADYEGAVLSEPNDPVALLQAIRRATALCGQRFANPRGWADSARRYEDFFTLITAPPVAGVPAHVPSPLLPSWAGYAGLVWPDESVSLE